MQQILFIFLGVILLAGPAHAAAQPFDQWLNGVRQQALAQGISRTIVDQALSGIEPKARIIELDRKQPEGTLTFAQYRQRVITPKRIRQGRALMRQHSALLNQISERYGVQPQYIVALWGIETSYGSNTGGFGVIEALATLAYDGRRSDFFRTELLQALKILDEGHIAPSRMTGSWAGAMGQNQFMPSSFFNFAVDGNGDGRRDIWNSLPDIFASTANYLAQSGWKGDERWGRAVSIPDNLPRHLVGKNNRKPLKFWAKTGITQPGGNPIPVLPGFEASLIAPDGMDGQAFLVYNNFHTLLKWNRSTYFASSVGILADAISGSGSG